MRKRFLLAALGITLCNVLILFVILAYFISSESGVNGSPFWFMFKHKAFSITITICMTLSGIISFFMYNKIMQPVKVLQEQLERTTEEIKKAEKIRSEFVANVTHELKTPLTSISGFAETLQDGAAEDPEIRAKFIDIIAIEAARLKRLIEDVLILSDIEQKKVPMMKEAIDVEQCIEELIYMMQPIAENRNVVLFFKVEAGREYFIEGDRDRFIQMMTNLIENAIKYSKPEGGKVFIEIGSLKKKIYIKVADEGIGIEEENFDRLFERFYRVDKSRNKKEGGTGLGLSIVKHIVALLEGQISLESRLGEGSCFTISFDEAKI